MVYNFDFSDTYYATPVLVNEKAMRRSTERRLLLEKEKPTTELMTGLYIDEDKRVVHADEGKIYLRLKSNGRTIRVERSCDYDPPYIGE